MNEPVLLNSMYRRQLLKMRREKSPALVPSAHWANAI